MSIDELSIDVNDRRIPLEGTFNTRDVGGLRVGDTFIRRGQLLRSDGLHQLTDADRVVLADRGLKTIIDLRNEHERAEHISALDGVGAEVISLPIQSGEIDADATEMPSLREAYRLIVELGGPSLAAAISQLGAPGAMPALVHCTAGKDRTGVLIGLVLSMVGVDDESIIADYAVSGDLLGEAFAERIGLGDQLEVELDEAALADLLSSPAELLAEVFGEIRGRDGSIEAYLVRNGMAPEVPAALRDALIAEPPR